MKLKAILSGNKLTFPKLTIVRKQEIEVEIEVPDEEVRVYSDEDLETMSVSELAHLIWDNVEVDKKEINRDYKELLIETLSEKHR